MGRWTTRKDERNGPHLLTTVLLSAGLAATGMAVAAPAGASTCQKSHPNLSRGSGSASKPGGTPLWSGPSSTCRNIRHIPRGAKLFYHCWRFSPENNLFTHVRIAGTQRTGWVYNGNLSDGGLHSDKTSCAPTGPHG